MSDRMPILYNPYLHLHYPIHLIYRACAMCIDSFHFMMMLLLLQLHVIHNFEICIIFSSSVVFSFHHKQMIPINNEKNPVQSDHWNANRIVIVDSFIHLLAMYQVLLKSKSFVSSTVLLRISISYWPFHDNRLTLFVLTSVFPQQSKWWPLYARISLLFNVRTQKSLSLCSTSRKLCFYLPLELFDFEQLNRSQHVINHFSIFLNMNFQLNTLNRPIICSVYKTVTIFKPSINLTRPHVVNCISERHTVVTLFSAAIHVCMRVCVCVIMQLRYE